MKGKLNNHPPPSPRSIKCLFFHLSENLNRRPSAYSRKYGNRLTANSRFFFLKTWIFIHAENQFFPGTHVRSSRDAREQFFFVFLPGPHFVITLTPGLSLDRSCVHEFCKNTRYFVDYE